jgi:LmbE family N-acetylglucosaminyl deacetylase
VWARQRARLKNLCKTCYIPLGSNRFKARYSLGLRNRLFAPLFGRKRFGWKARVAFWGAFLGLLVGGYYWQPLRYEFFPPEAPKLARVEPEFIRAGARVLVVAGHPDDSEFYMGGTLLRMQEAGCVIRLVAMTDGDRAYYPFGVPEGLTETRRGEQSRAAKMWGGDVVFLGYRDGRLPINDETVADLLAEIEEFKPDVVLAADPKYRPRRAHRDHTNAGENAMLALEKWSGSCTVALYSTRAPNCWVDITRYWFGKKELVAVHESQFYGERLQWITGMLAERATEEGERAGLSMAESYRVFER